MKYIIKKKIKEVFNVINVNDLYPFIIFVTEIKN